MTAIEPPMLRPLSLSQLLDRAIRLYRQNFLVFIGIIAVALVPLTILEYGVSLLSYDSTQRALAQLRDPVIARNPLQMLSAEVNAMGGGNAAIISILTFILVQCIATGALAKAIEDSYLGRPVNILDSYRKIATLWLPLLLAMVVAIIITFVLYLWTIVPCVGWLTGPGMLLFFSYAVYRLIPAAVVIEHRQGLGSAIGAIGRAWELTRRRFWWVLGFVVVLGVLAWIILIGPTALVSGLSGLLTKNIMPQADAQVQFAIQSALSQTVSFLFQLIYIPLQLTALILMYFDLRVRTEGFDLAMLAASAGEGQAALETTPQAPPAEPKSLVTLNEAGYFAAISLGVLLLCGILYGIVLAFALMSVGASRGF